MLTRVLSRIEKRGHIGFLLITAACLAGCGKSVKPMPATYPVHGKVIHKDGKPVTAGMVQFQPEADTSVTTTGTIQNDGTYRLTTIRDRVRAEGAVAGPNRVIVSPGAAADVTMSPNRNMKMAGRPVPTIYPTPYAVEPRDNEFNLNVE
jgi:hypothetical protein